MISETRAGHGDVFLSYWVWLDIVTFGVDLERQQASLTVHQPAA